MSNQRCEGPRHINKLLLCGLICAGACINKLDSADAFTVSAQFSGKQKPLLDFNDPDASRFFQYDKDGRLTAKVFNERGDVLPDFSYAGYKGGGVAIPTVPVRITLEPGDGTTDDTQRIQDALDAIGEMGMDEHGFRGCLLLKRGVYRIEGSLKVNRSGVVLRGEGGGKDGTVLFAVKTKDIRGNLIEIGSADKLPDPHYYVQPSAHSVPQSNDFFKITQEVVPLGGSTVEVESADQFEVGDTIVIVRFASDQWLNEIGMDDIPKRPDTPPEQTRNWTVEEYHIGYERTVTGIKENRIEFKPPIVTAVSQRSGGGGIYKYNEDRYHHIGVENMRFVAEFDPTIIHDTRGKKYYADEAICRRAVMMAYVKNTWVRDVKMVHFNHGISIENGSKWVTVQDAAYLAPVSRLQGGRRYVINITSRSSQCLVQRCFAEGARHAFAFGSRVPGPNVFLDNMSVDGDTSGPHHRWSTGGLYDNCNVLNLTVENRGYLGSGQGWAGADFVLWNTVGNISVQSPPGTINVSFGHVGTKGSNHGFEGEEGPHESFGEHVSPRSLYLTQLKQRLGEDAVTHVTTEPQRNDMIHQDFQERYARNGFFRAGDAPDMRNGYSTGWTEIFMNRWNEFNQSISDVQIIGSAKVGGFVEGIYKINGIPDYGGQNVYAWFIADGPDRIWPAEWTEIPGQAGRMYQIDPADSGKIIRFQVTPACPVTGRLKTPVASSNYVYGGDPSCLYENLALGAAVHSFGVPHRPGADRAFENMVDGDASTRMQWDSNIEADISKYWFVLDLGSELPQIK